MINCRINVKEKMKKRMLNIPSSWDTDEDVPQKQWEELFGNSEDEEENNF